jgi:hypothetical protein
VEKVMTIETLLILVLVMNAVLLIASMTMISESRRKTEEWKEFAMDQYDRTNKVFEWLCNNLSEYGDFGHGEHENVIAFRKKK